MLEAATTATVSITAAFATWDHMLAEKKLTAEGLGVRRVETWRP
jgi:hypothetical protein